MKKTLRVYHENGRLKNLKEKENFGLDYEKGISYTYNNTITYSRNSSMGITCCAPVLDCP